MAVFIIVVRFHEDEPQMLPELEDCLQRIYPDFISEREFGVHAVSSEGNADMVLRSLGYNELNLRDFLMVFEVGKSVAQGMVTTHFFNEVSRRSSDSLR